MSINPTIKKLKVIQLTGIPASGKSTIEANIRFLLKVGGLKDFEISNKIAFLGPMVFRRSGSCRSPVPRA